MFFRSRGDQLPSYRSQPERVRYQCKFRMHLRSNNATSRIVMEIGPDMNPVEVAEVYRKLRGVVKGTRSRVRPLSERMAVLAGVGCEPTGKGNLASTPSGVEPAESGMEPRQRRQLRQGRARHSEATYSAWMVVATCWTVCRPEPIQPTSGQQPRLVETVRHCAAHTSDLRLSVATVHSNST